MMAQYIPDLIRQVGQSTGSSLLGFIAKAATAVLRTVQDKLRERVSVLDFGAVGDGIADDTAAIQAAINYVASGDFDGDLFFPRGKYRTTTDLNVPGTANVRLIGEGGLYTCSTIYVDHGGAGIYNAGDQTFCVHNLAFVSDRVAHPTAFGIKVDGNAVGMTIEKCTFNGLGNMGIYLKGAFACIIDQCLFVGTGRAGMLIGGGAGTKINTPTFQDNYGSALELSGNGHTVDTPFFENNCRDNDPAGKNANWHELLVTANGSQITVIGGTLNTNAANNKTPVEIDGNMVVIDGMKPDSKGAAPNWIFVNGQYAGVTTRNTYMSITGTRSNCIEQHPGVPGSFSADLLIGGASLAGSAIVSSGSNANGFWVQYASGLQVCVLGGAFYDAVATNYQTDWTFPQPFKDGKAFVAGCSGAADPTYKPNASVKVRAVVPQKATILLSDNDIGYNVFAIGMWK